MSLYDDEKSNLYLKSSKKTTSSDIDTQPSSDNSDIESKVTKAIIKEQPHLKYGRMFTFYYINNDPVFAIGPDWAYFACMFCIDILFVYFMLTVLWGKVYSLVYIVAVLFCLAQLGLYFLTATINPGLPKYDYERQAIMPGCKDNFRKCKECKLWINCNKKTYHCDCCDVCVEGYDHHCPWTTKCVARGNIKFFYIFLVATFLTLMYFIFAVLTMGLYAKSKGIKA